jgi:TRAP-type C4-dicarboxylate transport system substrate-binding protein
MKFLTRTLIAAAVATFAALPVQAQQVVLKVAHQMPPNSNVNKSLIEPWCEKIAKESGDKLKCQIFPAMTLGGTPAQLFDQARDGIADIVWTLPGYSAGRFVKSEVFELPFFTKTAKGSSQALWAFVQKNAQDEFRGVKVLWLHTNDGSSFHMSPGKNIAKLEDLKGMKIRAATRLNSRMLAALGATPVQMPLPAVPESMSKGVVDGAMVPWEGVPAFKLQEVSKSHVDVADGHPKFANSIFAFVMNQAKYNSLPPELKKVIDDNSGLAASAWAGEKGFDAIVAPHHKLATDRGNTITKIDAKELQRWIKASDEVDDGWVKDVSAKGADGKALLEDARALIKQYDR